MGVKAHDLKEARCNTLTPRSPRTAGIAWFRSSKRRVHVRGGRGRLERGEIHLLGVGAALAAGQRGERRQPRAASTTAPHARKRSPAQVPDEEARKICERREKTGWSPRRLADEPDIKRPHSTVHRVLRRGGCSRRPRPEPPAVIRYEWPCPGNLLHMDVKKLGRFEAPGPCPDRRPPAALATGRLGVRALDRRRLLAPCLRGDPRRRAGRDGGRLHPPGLRVVSKSAGSPSRD